MTFDHLYIGRSQAGIGQRRTYQRGLGRRVGSRQRTGTPIVIDRAAAYDGSHAVAVAQGIRQAFQDDEARALAPDIDRKSDVEGKCVSVRVDLGGRRILKKNKKKKN